MTTKLNATRLECRLTPTVITVNSVLDTVAVDGVVTLREAILAANTNTAVGDAPAGTPSTSVTPDEIRFNLPAGSGPIVVTGTVLPAITESMSILGGTQPGYAGSPLVSIASQGTYGTPTSRLPVGLRLEGHTGSTIQGLYIVGFDQYQVSIDRAASSTVATGQHQLLSNWLSGDIVRSPLVTRPNGVLLRGDGGNFLQDNRIDLCINSYVRIESDGNVFQRNQFGWYDTSVLKVNDAVVLGLNSLDTARLASRNTIGGIDSAGGASPGNSFARYNNSGIRAEKSEYTNAFLGNTFRGSGNPAIGIGTNPSDPLTGNAPRLYSATSDASTTTVTGLMQGKPNYRYRLEFFKGPDGRQFIGYFDVITDAAGNAPFTTNQLLLPIRGNVTATATERANVNKVTTATSEFADEVVVRPARYFAVGTDSGTPSQAKLYRADGSVALSLQPYGGFTGGVRVAAGDVNGDNVDDLITAAGPGGGPHVKVFSGADGSLLASFFAYVPGFDKGVFIAAGDIDGDGLSEIVTGADAGGGPHVQTFNGRTGIRGNGFFAYDQGFSGGIRVATGDVDGDGKDEIITGAGAGGGPHVKVFADDGFLLRSFFAFEQSFTKGIYVAAGNFGRSSGDDIVIGSGAGASPVVRVYDGLSGNRTQSFSVYPESFRGGVKVAMAPLTPAGADVLITGAGPGGGPQVRRLKYDMGAPGGLADLGSFFAFDLNLTSGIFVGA